MNVVDEKCYSKVSVTKSLNNFESEKLFKDKAYGNVILTKNSKNS